MHTLPCLVGRAARAERYTHLTASVLLLHADFLDGPLDTNIERLRYAGGWGWHEGGRATWRAWGRRAQSAACSSAPCRRPLPHAHPCCACTCLLAVMNLLIHMSRQYAQRGRGTVFLVTNFAYVVSVLKVGGSTARPCRSAVVALLRLLAWAVLHREAQGENQG